MSNECDTKDYRGFKIKIYQDEDSLDPREQFDPFGKMVCFHSKYRLGDKHDFSDPDELTEFLKEEEAIYLPLFLYDHSGISMSTSRGYPFNCPWDSGQVGVIYVTRNDARKEYPKGQYKEKVLTLLEGEVETYDSYISGDVFGWVVEDANGESLDSCWGYYGHKEMNFMIDTAKESVDSRIEMLKKAHADKLKIQIANRVPLRLREMAPAFEVAS